MVKEEQHPFVTRAAPRVILPLAATTATVVLVALFLWIPVAGAAAAEQQQRIIVGSNTTSPCNIGGNNAAKEEEEEEDGGCLSLTFIAHAQPQLEGFDMASDLGSSAIVRRNSYATLGTKNQNKAACRDKNGRYISCTTAPYTGNKRKCGDFTRDCH